MSPILLNSGGHDTGGGRELFQAGREVAGVCVMKGNELKLKEIEACHTRWSGERWCPREWEVKSV